jgi:predicted MPP superfamily phosphohydrolase
VFPPLRNLFGRSDLERNPTGGWAQWIDRHVARLSYAVLVEPTWLEVNRLTIPLPTDSPARGLRIVQLSDFHFQRRVPARYVERCVAAANAENPDLIALTGDYVHKGHRYVEGIAELLSRLSAPLGVFAVLGNHDHAVRNALGFRRYPKLHQRIVEALVQRGIRVLHNELMTVELDGLRYQISGVDDLWSRRCRPDVALVGLDPGLPHVMLAHHPRTIELLDGRRCDLMLSGHTHGGQIHTQQFGSVTLGRRMKRYAAGLYAHGDSRLYVNKGVGFGLPIRYNRRPEIAVFDLVPNLPDRSDRQ